MAPILTYIQPLYDVCHTCHICHICHIWHLWRLEFDICVYVNIGVKRSGRTSRMQPTILNILQNHFEGYKQKYPVTWFFLCIFQDFLCIFWESRSSTSCPPRNLKSLVLLSIPHRNGISLLANSYLTVFRTPLHVWL